jgi:hypothetical protein
MTTTTNVREPERCPSCDRFNAVPADGQWRYSQSGKVFDSQEAADRAAAYVNDHRDGWEAIALVDDQGQLRIATRRETA